MHVRARGFTMRSDQTSHASTPAGEEDCDRHDESRGGWRHTGHQPHQNKPCRSTVRSRSDLLRPPSAGTRRTVHRRTCTPSCSGNLLFADTPGSLQPAGGRSRTTCIRRAAVHHGASATAPTTPKHTCTTRTVTRGCESLRKGHGAHLLAVCSRLLASPLSGGTDSLFSSDALAVSIADCGWHRCVSKESDVSTRARHAASAPLST
jgi:hypothetical protein